MVVPWQDGTPQVYEILDRLVDIPVTVPPLYMLRNHGKPLKDKPWLVAKVDEGVKADMWKLIHRSYFVTDAKRESILRNMLRLWPLEVSVPEARDWPAWELAEKVYDTIRTTVVGVHERFCSQELGPEEDDNVLDQALPFRVEEAARKDVYPTIADISMGGRPDTRILETVGKHRLLTQ